MFLSGIRGGFRELKSIAVLLSALVEMHGSADFEEALGKLVQAGLVVTDFSLYRSSAGRRSSSPAAWVFRLSPSGHRRLLLLLVKEPARGGR